MDRVIHKISTGCPLVVHSLCVGRFGVERVTTRGGHHAPTVRTCNTPHTRKATTVSEPTTDPLANLSPAEIATLTAEASGWQPNDGDEVEGTVLAIKSAYSEVKNANYPIVFVYTDSGECVAVHCFQTVIENEMKSQRPLPGERIYVKRIGADPNQQVKKGQSPTIRYAVHVSRETAADPWSHMS